MESAHSAYLYYQPGYLPSGAGPLNGLRLGVKDLFHVAGLSTSAGNPDWLNSHEIPTQTNHTVTRLVAAGAQFMGKTLTDELAYSLNGSNIHYGTPHNTVTPERLSGGSSSGSAVLVGCNEIDIGLGTDTGGSIRVPASYNGLYGIRTSHGLIDNDQMVALAPRFDTIGWLTRDAQTLQMVGKQLLPETLSFQAQDTTLLLPTKIWQSIDYFPLIQPIIARWAQQWPLLEQHGPTVQQLNKAGEAFRTLQGRQIWQQHGQWFEQQQPLMADDIAERMRWCATLTEQQQQHAEQQRLACQHWLSTLFEAAPQTVILWPTTPGSAPLKQDSGPHLAAYRNQLMALTAPAGLAGLPQLHLPLTHNTDGGAIGVSLLGQAGSDQLLLELAQQMEHR